MTNIKYIDFIKELSKDFNLSIEKEYTLRLPNDNKTIKHFVRSVANIVKIYDGKNEYSYMISNKRNEEVLIKGIELRYLGIKTFNEIIKETNIKLKSENCKIDEGGGCYSNGTRYFYKEFYIEL